MELRRILDAQRKRAHEVRELTELPSNVALSRMFRDRDRQIAEAKQEAELRLHDADARLVEVNLKDAEIQAKDAEIQVKDAEIQTKDAEIQTKDSEIRMLLAELQQRLADVNAKEAEIAAKEAEIAAKDAEIRGVHEEAAARLALLTESDRLVQELGEALRAKEAEAEEVRTQIAAAHYTDSESLQMQLEVLMQAAQERLEALESVTAALQELNAQLGRG